MAEAYNPSACDIESATITPFGTEGSGDVIEITPLISGFSISQSISSPMLHVVLRCYDSIGLLENLPIRGEEKINIKIKAHDLGVEKEIKGRIHKINNVVASEPKDALSYSLHIATEISYEASLYNIITAFRNKPASTMAEDIFKKYISTLEKDNSARAENIPYGGKKYTLQKDRKRHFYIQPSEGFLRLTIPRLITQDALSFVAAKSFSADSPSCTFRFFENFDGYHWCTDEFLIRKANENNRIVELNYQAFTSLDPRDIVSQVTAIEEMKNTRRADVGSELQGAYLSTAYEIDLNNHTARRYNYKYVDELKKFASSVGKNNNPSIQNDIHTKDFIEETFNVERDNAKQFMIFRDYDADTSGGKGEVVRGEQHYRQIAQNSLAYSSHQQSIRVSASLKGRLDLQAGQVTKVVARKLNASGENVENRQLSGHYLIEAVIHTVSDGLLETELSLIKYDWTSRSG